MAGLALALWGLFGLLALAGRALLQRRRTGAWGISGMRPGAGAAEWAAGVLFVGSLAAGVAAPILDVADVLEPVEGLDRPGVHAVGLALYALGLAGTLGAQLAMGSAWRIGVDESERTGLVTAGPFAIVRNPIYACMLPTVAGLGMLVPNAVALAGVAGLLLALELQVRVVEEPHLRRAHGAGYEAYAGRVGRFVPGLGLIRSGRPASR